jgi:hypothetical protein
MYTHLFYHEAQRKLQKIKPNKTDTCVIFVALLEPNGSCLVSLMGGFMLLGQPIAPPKMG